MPKFLDIETRIYRHKSLDRKPQLRGSWLRINNRTWSWGLVLTFSLRDARPRLEVWWAGNKPKHTIIGLEPWRVKRLRCGESW